MDVRKPNPQILEEACSWLVDLNESESDLSTRRKFDAWLRRSPENIRAYLEVSAFWEDAKFLWDERTLCK
jgi:ferric-dicitrate binding protein FerR (iron transport regulator)